MFSVAFFILRFCLLLNFVTRWLWIVSVGGALDLVTGALMSFDAGLLTATGAFSFRFLTAKGYEGTAVIVFSPS